MALNILLTMQKISQGNQQTCCRLLQKRQDATSLEGPFQNGTTTESCTIPPLRLDLTEPCWLNTGRSATTNSCQSINVYCSETDNVIVMSQHCPLEQQVQLLAIKLLRSFSLFIIVSKVFFRNYVEFIDFKS